MGAGLWWVISSVVALFAGGWVAGHLSDSPDKTDAVLRGQLTWGVAAIVMVYLLASIVGTVVKGGASVVGKAASVAGAGIGAGQVWWATWPSVSWQPTASRSTVSRTKSKTDRAYRQPRPAARRNRRPSLGRSRADDVGSNERGCDWKRSGE